MIFSAEDVAALSKSLSCWEYAEYVCAFLVAVACAGEYIADFSDRFTGGIEERKRRLAKRSTLLLIAALALELICLVKTNSLSGLLIGSLSDKAEKAEKNAEQAIADSAIAEKQSAQATIDAGKATDASTAAVKVSRNAKDLAQGARLEADSFENDIRAANAQSAEAKQESTSVSVKLADRTLTDLQISLIAGRLARYAGQEVEIVAYWENKESVGIADRILTGLIKARWIYIPPQSRVLEAAGVNGVLVWSHPSADVSTKEAVAALISALNEQSIDAEARFQNPNNPKTNRITLDIGAKR